MSRILYLAADPVPAPKGAAVRITRTVETLASLGHEVRLLTLQGPRPQPPLAGIEHQRVVLGQQNFLERMLEFRDRSEQWLGQQDIADLVIFRGIFEGIPAIRWAAPKQVPVVYEAHGFPSIELPYHYPGIEREAGLMAKLIAEENLALAAAARVLTPSETGRRFLLQRGVRPERIEVVANAVDPALFRPPVAELAAEPPYRVVYQGTLAPWQGILTLLEALVPLRGSGTVELHLVGPMKLGWRRELRAAARRLRIHHLVRFAGPTQPENLAAVLASAVVTAAPMPADPRNALQGCCPIKLLEYMACGRAILATSIAPIEEILTDRHDAYLVRPGSPHELFRGLEWLLAHPEQRLLLGAAARATALARYTPERFRARLAEALAALLAR